MKIFIPLFLIASIIVNGQSKPYYKQTITAYELNKKDTIAKKVFVTLLDSLRNTIETENNIQNAISGSKSEFKKTKSIVEVDTERLYVSATIDENGNTNKLIYVYDDKKNRIANYQLKNGDTINAQKRIYNEFGESIKLFNKRKENHDYFLSMEWEYDANKNVTECKTYNPEGKLIGFDKYENEYKKDETILTKFSYVNGKDFVRRQKQIKKNNDIITYYYHNSTGYNYGIKIQSIDGGMSIRSEDEKGNLKELKIFDDKKNLIAFVKNVEEKI